MSVTQAELEITRELVARFVAARQSEATAVAWARYVIAHSPDDVLARIGMAEAIKRRLASGASLVAKIKTRAPGRYVVKSGEGRAYDVVLYGAEPADASCSCKDFLASSLGVCKHVVFARAQGKPGFAPRPVLDWSPTRPWTGADAPFHRLTLSAPVPGTELHWNAIHETLLRPNHDVASPAPFAAHAIKLRERLGDDVSPAASAVIAALSEEAERRRRFESDGARALAFVAKSKRTLFPYQHEGVERLLRDGRLLLGDDMGLGKTTQVIAAASALFSAGAIKKALVVVPAPLKAQWAREWGEVSKVAITIVDGTAEARATLLKKTQLGVLLMNYEQVVRDPEPVRAFAPDLIVLDEAQRIKNWAAKTSHVMKSLTPRYRWILTGTPFENRLDELASLVEWIDDHAMEPKWRLDAFHSERADGTTTVVGAKNLSTLRQRIEPCVLRRTRVEVLSQLPPRTDVERLLPMTDAQREPHDAITPDIAALVSIRNRRPLKPGEFLRLMKLLNLQRMACNAAVLSNDAAAWESLKDASPEAALPAVGSPKLEEFRQIVRELVIAQGQKIAVFSQWRRMLKWAHWAIADLLREASVTAGFFTGAEPDARRRENVIRFHDDPSFRVLFLTDAGGVGLNLQRAASAIVNVELPWNPAVLEQRIGRVHRLGQKDPVSVILLVSADGIESRIKHVVNDKRALFRGLFDSDDDVITFERSGAFMTSLAKMLPKEALSSPEGLAVDDDEGDATPVDLRDAWDDDAPVTEAAPAPTPGAPRPATSDLPSGTLFADLRVERLPDGSVQVTAPPASADALVAALRSLADVIAASRSGPGGPER